MADSFAMMSGLAVRGALEKVVLPAFAKDPGIRVDVRWDLTTVVMQWASITASMASSSGAHSAAAGCASRNHPSADAP